MFNGPTSLQGAVGALLSEDSAPPMGGSITVQSAVGQPKMLECRIKMHGSTRVLLSYVYEVKAASPLPALQWFSYAHPGISAAHNRDASEVFLLPLAPEVTMHTQVSLSSTWN